MFSSGTRLAKSTLLPPCLEQHIAQTMSFQVTHIRLSQKPPDPRRKIIIVLCALQKGFEMIAWVAELLPHFCKVRGCPEQDLQPSSHDCNDMRRIPCSGCRPYPPGDHVRHTSEHHCEDGLESGPLGLRLFESILHLVRPLSFTFDFRHQAGHFHGCQLNPRCQLSACPINLRGMYRLILQSRQSVEQRKLVEDLRDVYRDGTVQFGGFAVGDYFFLCGNRIDVADRDGFQV
ncbi:hypothetical protein COMA2_80141 [Candidatus Nitrospira nitrificans]|uniref:Uncharacterized protein n=1 Tax=Candidatus Nitrospira nitrificans TaxID=1742973 RepID=A0A0S4LSW0_9BACT|nr:hypothetical protein COMA2_80141 [Candidatus Nitrospira nitrificans]